MVDFMTCDDFVGSPLGDQLFKIASTAGLAYKLGGQPIFPDWEGQGAFNVPDEFFTTLVPAECDIIDFNGPFDPSDFSEIMYDVCEWFTPSDAIQGRVESEYPEFFKGGHHTAIHSSQSLPAEYYERRVNEVLAGRPDTQFIVFSEMTQLTPVHFILSLLCDSHITSETSFSWWSNFLSDAFAVLEEK